MWCEYKTCVFLNCQIRQRKTKHEWDVHKFSQVLEDYPIRNFCHLWWLLLVECVQRASLCGCQWARELQARVGRWWGADVCETTRHAQPDPTPRHHSQRQSFRRRAAGYETQSRNMSWGGVLSWTLTAPVLLSCLPVCCPWITSDWRFPQSPIINPAFLFAIAVGA
jgi:hypothetical protein